MTYQELLTKLNKVFDDENSITSVVDEETKHLYDWFENVAGVIELGLDGEYIGVVTNNEDKIDNNYICYCAFPFVAQSCNVIAKNYEDLIKVLLSVNDLYALANVKDDTYEEFEKVNTDIFKVRSDYDYENQLSPFDIEQDHKAFQQRLANEFNVQPFNSLKETYDYLIECSKVELDKMLISNDQDFE